MSVTKRDTELIVLGFQCYDAQPKVDFTKLATLAGYSNAASAQTCYNSAKKKFLNSTASAASLTTGITVPGSTPTPATPKKRKASTKTNNADGTPTTNTSKRGKGKGGAPTTKATNNNNGNGDADDDDEDFSADANAVAMKIEEDAAAEAAATQLNAEKEAQILKMAADILGGDRSGAKAKTESEDENGNDVMEMKGEGAVVKTEEGQAKAKGEEKVEEMEKKADDEVLFANFTDFLEGEEKGENADEA